MDVPQARQVARPAWLNSRTVLGALLFALAVLGGARALQSARATVPVWTAARDLPAGAQLIPEDLRPARVNLPTDLLARYAAPTTVLKGAVLTDAVHEGELIAVGSLTRGEPAERGRSITIPIAAEHPLGSELRQGDRIDVLATFDPDDPRARTVPVARDIEVLDLVSAQGLVGSEGSIVGVTVAVTPQQAANIAFAIHTAEIDLARVEAQGDAPAARTVRREDFG